MTHDQKPQSSKSQSIKVTTPLYCSFLDLTPPPTPTHLFSLPFSSHCQVVYSFLSSDLLHAQASLFEERDVGVLLALVTLLLGIVARNFEGFESLVPRLVAVLGRLMKKDVSPDYHYYGIPSPWLQVLPTPPSAHSPDCQNLTCEAYPPPPPLPPPTPHCCGDLARWEWGIPREIGRIQNGPLQFGAGAWIARVYKASG